MRHPKHKVVLQIEGCVIDCSAVCSVTIMASDRNKYFLAVGFLASERTITLPVGDKEEAYIILSYIKKGMVAAAEGGHGLFEEGEEDGGEPNI